MTNETILTNAVLVLGDATLYGTLIGPRRTDRRRAAEAGPPHSPCMISMATI